MPSAAELRELSRVLDALGDDEGPGARGELDDGPEHGTRRSLRAALDERQVDLQDVEADLGEEAEPGIAGADVIGREADAGAPASLEARARAVEVVQLLPLGELDDQALRRERVSRQDGKERAAAELRGLERRR